MTSDGVPQYESGNLTICPELGVVRNSRGESARLGPVNMKVLALLLGRPRQVVSRSEIFAEVWTNQAVGDDVLTRAISDIRARLTQLSGRGDQIETVPKRGYRWTADVREGGPNEPATSPHLATASAAVPISASASPGGGKPAGDSSTGGNPATDSAAGAGSSGGNLAGNRRTGDKRAGDRAGDKRGSAPPRGGTVLGTLSLAALLRGGLIYLAAFIGIASAAVWLIDVFAPPAPTVIAVLPTRADDSHRDLAAHVDQRLGDSLIGIDRVDLLSRSAVDSRPDNPFPYFYSEFGARWLVESEVRELAGETTLGVALVDARAGIVLFQAAGAIEAGGSQEDPNVAKVFRALELYIVSQQSP